MFQKLETVNANKSSTVYLEKTKLIWGFRNIKYRVLHD